MIDIVSLLTDLIRIDTTNPPGNESAAIELIREVLVSHGIDVEIHALDPARPCLVARVPGNGSAPPLLIQGHLDVVGVEDQDWQHDPFSGSVIDGWIWGRGALDMKGPISMMIEAMIRTAAGPTPAGDVVLCLVPDEEDGGECGAGFLVSEHPELFDGVEYALGEFGGFPFVFDGVRFAPVQVSERVGVSFELTFRGEPGHGSMPRRGGSMARLGACLTALDEKAMPTHVTGPTRLMLEAMAPHVSRFTRVALRAVLDQRTQGPAIAALRTRLGVMDSLLRNTVSPTVVSGGNNDNVIPATTHLRLDGRMLPGRSLVEFRDELVAIVGEDVEITYVGSPTGESPDPDLGLFELLASELRVMDPDLIPIPYMSPAVTDARWFSRLGIQTYGFTPMLLPDGFAFQETVHGANERIPVDVLRPGADTLVRVFSNYGRPIEGPT